jgi:hypothetical protein
VDDAVAAAMEMRRLVLAPSDNVSEVAGPIFVTLSPPNFFPFSDHADPVVVCVSRLFFNGQ